MVETACASGGTAFHHGYREVAGGFSDAVLVGGVERVSMLDTLTATTYFAYGSDYTYEGGTGCSFPGLYATMARAYFSKYGAMSHDEAIAEATRIWDTINVPNLSHNVLPTRSRATLVLRKDRDHSVRYVRLRKL